MKEFLGDNSIIGSSSARHKGRLHRRNQATEMGPDSGHNDLRNHFIDRVAQTDGPIIAQ